MKKHLTNAIIASLVVSSPAAAASHGSEPRPLINRPMGVAVTTTTLEDARRYDCQKQQAIRPEKVWGPDTDLCWWWSLQPYRRWFH
jgi:hypothetical protein